MTAVSIARFVSRVGLVAIVAGIVSLVGVELTGIIAKNQAVAHELASARADVAALTMRERNVRRTIRRLQSPDGAVPEIHERLRLVGANEELIYVRGYGRPTPEPVP